MKEEISLVLFVFPLCLCGEKNKTTKAQRLAQKDTKFTSNQPISKSANYHISILFYFYKKITGTAANSDY